MASNLYDVAIPEATAEDNGKVLTVVDGKWEKVTSTAELPEAESLSETDATVLAVVDGEWVAAVITVDDGHTVVTVPEGE